MRISFYSLTVLFFLVSLSFPEGWKSGPVPASGYDAHEFGDKRNWSVLLTKNGVAAIPYAAYRDSINAQVPQAMRDDTADGYEWDKKAFRFKSGYLGWFVFGRQHVKNFFSDWLLMDTSSEAKLDSWEIYRPDTNYPEESWSWWWCDKTGQRIQPLVYGLELSSMVACGDTIYAMNAGEKSGTFYRFIHGDTSWTFDTLFRFKEEPYLLQRDDQNKILILTASRLLRYDPATNEITTLLNNNFWIWLDPNSMAFDKGSIYLGMQGGILKINYAEPYPMEWFTKE